MTPVTRTRQPTKKQTNKQKIAFYFMAIYAWFFTCPVLCFCIESWSDVNLNCAMPILYVFAWLVFYCTLRTLSLFFIENSPYISSLYIENYIGFYGLLFEYSGLIVVLFSWIGFFFVYCVLFNEQRQVHWKIIYVCEAKQQQRKNTERDS